MIDLNLLVLLDAVLQEGSVGRAAKRLHVTSSAVSNGLARLRAATGDPWVTRQGRGIVPTPLATSMAPSIRRSLAELEAVAERKRFDPATTTRTFTLAIADVGQVVRVPAVASRLAREMPRARLRIVGVQSLVSLGGVAGTEVDVAIGVPETVTGVHSKRLFEERTVLVGRRARGDSSTGALRHIAVEMVPGYGDPVDTAYAKANLARDVALTVPTFMTAAAIVASTDYVTTMPTSLYLSLASRFGLAVIEDAPALTIAMHMWWHERTHADAACVAFRSLLEAVMRKADLSESRPRATGGPARGLPPAKRRRSGPRRADRG